MSGNISASQSDTGFTALSVIVPVFNESALLATSLARLATLRRRGTELIVVDGGSEDDTCAIAERFSDRVVRSTKGRAVQMNAGADAASADVLLFLHADAILPDDADRIILDGLASGRRHWGRFDVQLSGRHPILRIVEYLMNLRSRLTGIATGDQGMFVTRAAFVAAGGFPEIALMEDVAISAVLKRIGRPLCLRAKLHSSSRRWERHGILRTIVLMWQLRLRYFLGENPAELAKSYYGDGNQDSGICQSASRR